jgi:hypothetical protein
MNEALEMLRKTCLATFVILYACTAKVEEPKDQAKRAADAYLASISMSDPERPVEVKDAGPHWVVIYHVPQGWAGGDRLVWVDKRTMKVADSIAWQ